MTKEEILIQMKNWEDPSYLENVIEKYKVYVSFLDHIFYQRYMNLIPSLNQSDEVKDKLHQTLISRNLIDEMGNLVAKPIIIININPKLILSSYDGHGGINVSKNGYKLFYNSYLIFASGDKSGIRDFDYSQSLEKLSQLTDLEKIYWCFVHKLTYEEFFKTIIMHENVHKWTSSIDKECDVIHALLIESMVEIEAREIAYRNGLEHISSFRNKEINVFNELTKGFPKELLDYCLLTADTSLLFDFFVSLYLDSPDQDRQDFYKELASIVETFARKKDSNNETQIPYQFDSLHDMLNWYAKLDENKIIAELKECIMKKANISNKLN